MRIAILVIIPIAVFLGCSKGTPHSDAGSCDAGACLDGGNDAGTDAGSDAGPLAPAPTWVASYDGDEFSRALDVSCTSTDGGAERCVGLVRYKTELLNLPDAGSIGPQSYGDILVSSFSESGVFTSQQPLLSGWDPISEQTGSFVDDDLRTSLLSDGEFLVSGTYVGRVFIGTPGGDNEELGPRTNDSIFMFLFHADGTIDNWVDTGNDRDQHLFAAQGLPSSGFVLAGSCEGDVPTTAGAFPCGDSQSGFVITLGSDWSTTNGFPFGGSTPASANDAIADATGDLFISGTFDETMTFAPGLDGGATNLVGAGENDGFLAEVTPAGQTAWVVLAGGLGEDSGGRLAAVPGGVLWTSLVSEGARVGTVFFPEQGQIVALVGARGSVTWAKRIEAPETAPLRIAAASDGSFALFGDDFLGRYAADGTQLWSLSGAEVRGAAFTQHSLIVAATVVGMTAFGTSIATSGDDTLRGVYAAFPR